MKTPIAILLIEDNEAERQMVRTMLQFGPESEYAVTDAGTASQAETALRESTFDIVLLSGDIRGGQGLEWLRELTQGTTTPVVMLAANSSERQAVAAIKGGAVDYFAKRQVSGELPWRTISQLLSRDVPQFGSRAEPTGNSSRSLTMAASRQGAHAPPEPLRMSPPLEDEEPRPSSPAPSARAVPELAGRVAAPTARNTESPVAVSAPRQAVFPGTGLAREPRASAAAAVGDPMPAAVAEPPPAAAMDPTPAPVAAAMEERAPVAVVAEELAPVAVAVPALAPTPVPAPVVPRPAESEIRISTAGIDREMEKLGIRRPQPSSTLVPQLIKEIQVLLDEIKAASHPRQLMTARKLTQRIRVSACHEPEAFAILQAPYAADAVREGHVLNTMILGMMLAESCEFVEEDIVALGIAALLHGVYCEVGGNEPVPAPGKAAAEIARALGAPGNVVLALEHSREHADGTGPEGLRDKQIVIDAQILLLADCFDHLYYQRWEFFTGTRIKAFLTGDPVAAQQTKDPIFILVGELRKWFQSRVLKALIFINGFYTTGSIVELTNRSVARVVGQNRNNPMLPIVEIISTSLGERPATPKRINLAQVSGVAIHKTLSYNSPAAAQARTGATADSAG